MSQMSNSTKRKAMEQDVDTDDLEERTMMQQPRTNFSEMEPAGDQGAPPARAPQTRASPASNVQQTRLNESGIVGEGLDDEVPGSVRANTDTVRPADLLLPQQQAGTCAPV